MNTVQSKRLPEPLREILSLYCHEDVSDGALGELRDLFRSGTSPDRMLSFRAQLAEAISLKNFDPLSLEYVVNIGFESMEEAITFLCSVWSSVFPGEPLPADRAPENR